MAGDVWDSPVAGKGSEIPHSRGLQRSHRLPAMIHGLAAKCQSKLVGGKLLQSRRVPEAPRSPERRGTRGQNKPPPCSNSWKTGSLLSSCSCFRWCF